MSDGASRPPLEAWAGELELEVVARGGSAADPAYTIDLVLDGRRRFDLRVTVAWVDGVGTSVWAYYGPEEMEIPKRVLRTMLRANYDHPFMKFALTDDDRPMLMAELGQRHDRDDLARALVRMTVLADRLLEPTASAVADRGILPDWTDRRGRNLKLLERYADEVEATMPPWSPPMPAPRRRGLLAQLFGLGR